MGASVVLFERGAMGGDCLNTGCVPSKALLAAAAKVASGMHAGSFGIEFAAPRIDFQAVHSHVHEVIAGIAPHDSVERFEGLGVKVVREEARFTGPREVTGTGGTRVIARRMVIATGSSPAVPPIAGLDTVPYLTNESLFDLTECPEHLLVLGGGPIGMEMAQAYRRFGAAVTIFEMASVLPQDDPELAGIVRDRLIGEGVEIVEGAKVVRVEAANVDGETPGVVVHWEPMSGEHVSGEHVSGEGTDERGGAAPDGPRQVGGSHLLVAAGRRPDLARLDLKRAGVDHGPGGVAVNGKLRTSNRRVYAIGDAIGQHQFTHAANYHAGIAMRNILFRMGAAADDSAMPWVTYTDPELAHVGLSEAAAAGRGLKIKILRASFAENDRARAERQTDGMIKIVTGPRGRILGATIVGLHAGELLLPWVLAISQRLKIGAMAGVIAPYPSLSEISKRAAGSYYTGALFSTRTRAIVRLLARLG